MQRKIEESSEPKFEMAGNIDSLRICLGKIEFTNQGLSSHLINADLRFFEDKNQSGLHVSNYYGFESVEKIFEKLKIDLSYEDEKIGNFKKKLTVLYISGTNLSAFSDSGIPGLKFLNLSDNGQLKMISLAESNKLEELQAFGCPYLNEVTLEKGFSGLKKLDVSYGAVTELKIGELENLEYLNIQNNQIKLLDLVNLPKLMYLFARGNSRLEFKWPKKINENSKLSIINVDSTNELLPKDIIYRAENYSDARLRKELNNFLSLVAGDREKMVSINRIQIILLGNSTAGKTELKYKILGEKRPENDFGSTHGMSYFHKNVGSKEVLGYDFGGQDYYHALHLPFLGSKSHYLLVWGNYKEENKKWGEYDPYNFTGISEEGSMKKDLLLYPIGYWLKSILYSHPEASVINFLKSSYFNSYKEYLKGQMKSRELRNIKNEYTNADVVNQIIEWEQFLSSQRIKKSGVYQKIFNDLAELYKNDINISRKINETFEETVRDIKAEFKLPVIDILQNINNEKRTEYFLNVKELRELNCVDVRSIMTFNFKEEKVDEWLKNEIISSNLIQENKILKSVKDFGSFLIDGNDIILRKSILIERIKEKAGLSKTQDIETFIQSLVDNYYILDLNVPENTSEKIFVVKVDAFTSCLYKVLDKKLLTVDKDQGYFTKEEAKGRLAKLPSNVEREFILNFLLENDIIFEVVVGSGNSEKYIAPTYLPEPEKEIETLFIQSFDKPDCIFEFNDFFHPNLMLQVVKKYKSELVVDLVDTKYLMWKNCVIIYNVEKKSGDEEEENKNTKTNQKHYLKLQLLLPDKDHPDRIPRFTISRSRSGYISNDQFARVFREIKSMVRLYSTRILVRAPYRDNVYIPYEDVSKSVSEATETDSINKLTGLVYHKGVLYPKYAFRHFLGEEFKAPLKIFIAYSKYDDMYRQELRDHLRPAVRSGHFIVFDDREMNVGEDWDVRLKNELEECDVFIVLLSSKTLGTPYVMDKEIPLALERKKKEGLMIIPVIVSPCNWEISGLSGVNAYDKAQSVVLNRDDLDFSRELGVNERALKWKKIVSQIATYQSGKPEQKKEPATGLDVGQDRRKGEITTTKTASPPLKIYLAYDERDDAYRKELKDFLRPAVNEQKIVVFDKREYDLGREWEKRAEEEIENSDIFILLISIRSLGGGSNISKELQQAIKKAERVQSGQRPYIIVPVVVGHCNWLHRTGLQAFDIFGANNPLKKDLGLKQADLLLAGVATLNGREEKWMKIVEQIEQYADNRRKQTDRSSTPDEPVAGNHKQDG